MIRRLTIPLSALALLAACDAAPPPPTDGPAHASVGGGGSALTNEGAVAPSLDVARYVGRWTGVEGMYLDIARRAGNEVRMTMQWDLDHKGTFAGTVTHEGIRFVRGDRTLMLRPSDGDATGLKYLAGKSDCLTVVPGEGYCR